MSFRLFISALTCAALTLGACTTTEAQRSALDTLTLGLTYIPNVQFAPAYIAEDQGFFEAEGIDVTVRHHGAEEGLFTALLSGDEDIVIASGDEAVVSAATGTALVSIGAYYRSYPGIVIVPEDSSIHSLADLKGHKIGIPGEYGSSWYATLAALKAGSLSAKDVDVVSIGYTQQAALASGSVDAVVGFSNNDLVQMQMSGLKVRAIDLGADVPLVAASIITTRSWAQAHPELATHAVAALSAGIASVIEDPQAALEATALRDETLNDEATRAVATAVLQATIPLWQGSDGNATPTQDIETWQAMAAFLAQIPGLMEGAVHVDDVVTNAYTSVQ